MPECCEGHIADSASHPCECCPKCPSLVSRPATILERMNQKQSEYQTQKAARQARELYEAQENEG